MELDFTFERQMELERKDAMKRGEEIGEARGIEKGIEKGVEVFVLDKIEDGISQEKIIAKLMKAYSLTEEKARQYVEKYVTV